MIISLDIINGLKIFFDCGAKLPPLAQSYYILQ